MAPRVTDRMQLGLVGSLLVNAAGAAATSTVLCIFLVTKFVHGAWIVVIVVPLLVLMFDRSGDDARISKELQPRPAYPPLVCHHNTIILPVTRGRSRHCDRPGVCVVHEQGHSRRLRGSRGGRYAKSASGLEKLETGVPLQVLPSPYRSFLAVMLAYIDEQEAMRRRLYHRVIAGVCATPLVAGTAAQSRRFFA